MNVNRGLNRPRAPDPRTAPDYVIDPTDVNNKALTDCYTIKWQSTFFRWYVLSRVPSRDLAVALSF